MERVPQRRTPAKKGKRPGIQKETRGKKSKGGFREDHAQGAHLGKEAQKTNLGIDAQEAHLGKEAQETHLGKEAQETHLGFDLSREGLTLKVPALKGSPQERPP